MYRFITFLFILMGLQGYSQCNPVASFPFSGNANDISGNGNNGILGGANLPVLTNDRYGNPNSAYEFGGFYNPNWIQIPNNPSLTFTNAISISLWFKQCSFAGMDGNGAYSSNGYFILISKAGDGLAADPGIWCSSYVNTSNNLEVSFSNTNDSINANVNFADNAAFECFDSCEWIHCVVVAENTTWKMYYNGQLKKQATIAATDFAAANAEDFYIGRMFGGPAIWYPFNGVIDDVNIYNCALSQAEITALYGNYLDPLSANNSIHIDSISVSASCASGGTITAYPNAANLPCQYSIDGGALQSSNTFSNLASGQHQVHVVSDCTTGDTMVNITKPSVIQNVSAAICQGANYQLRGGGIVNTSGTYIDTISTSSGCDSIFVTTITVSPVYSIAVSDSICSGSTYRLPDGIIVTTPGNYISTLHSVTGCDSIITTNLNYLSVFEDTAIVSDVTCFGRGDGSLYLSVLNGASPFTFEVSGQGTNTNGSFTNLDPGNYSYSISDIRGCTSFGSFSINEPDKIRITLHPVDTIVDANAFVNVKATCNFPLANYQWNPVAYFVCDTCPNTTLIASTDLKFKLAVTVQMNSGTCNSDTSGEIHLSPVLFTPNAFTPNGDGLNDTFRIAGTNFENITSFHMRIFDRWGNLIIDFDNPDVSAFAWDGKINNEAVQAGIYNYRYEYAVRIKEQEFITSKKGSIRIVK
jgi:gliding motility-associated-like protein